MDQKRIIEAKAILDEAIELHKPTHIFGMFSDLFSGIGGFSLGIRKPSRWQGSRDSKLKKKVSGEVVPR